MWKIDPPVYTASFSYATCTSRIRNKELRERLNQAADEVAASAGKYESAAEASELYLLNRDELSAASLTAAEMIAIYNYRMAKKKAVGRFIYDELILAAPNGRCPICGQRTVSTLDHVLPKAIYPELSVTPLNLIPACSDCNHAKSDTVPIGSETEPIHPYYDDLDGDPWLHATVVHTIPAAITFSVAAPISWPDSLKNRVATHFRTFKLAPLYASQAAQELNSIKHYLTQLHARAGENAVQQHLAEQADSRRMAYVNSWQTATYTALADDAWFYQGGFAL